MRACGVRACGVRAAGVRAAGVRAAGVRAWLAGWAHLVLSTIPLAGRKKGNGIRKGVYTLLLLDRRSRKGVYTLLLLDRRIHALLFAEN